MIKDAGYPADPWCVRESTLDLELLAQAESVFALSNGHIGLRGNLDEGEPHGIPGSYLAGYYEKRPLPYAENSYANPESSQSIVNVTNGKLIRLLVDDEPFDVRYGKLLSHERVLDLRAGTLTRVAEWESPAGKRVRVKTVRLVSFKQRAIAAIQYEVTALDNDVRVVVQSELVANEEVPAQSDDPREAAAMEQPLDAVDQTTNQYGAILVHRTKRSGLTMAVAMGHFFDSPQETETHVAPDWARTTAVATLEAGQCLRMEKILGYGWSASRSTQALRDQVAGAVSAARLNGFEGLCQQQREYLDEFWNDADVEIDGDDEIQQAVRFGLFHILQAGARAEGRGIAAKGLTGPGYDGHTFWDSEAFVLPVLMYTRPDAAAHALRWRHSTLNLAKQRAQMLGFRGAAFPWRTIHGEECSGYWPAGTAAVHATADIANAVDRYTPITGDEAVEIAGGIELLAEAARFWMSIGHFGHDEKWHVSGVTGPDEYTALVDDNTYTNLAAGHALLAAVRAVNRHPDVAGRLGIPADEVERWQVAGSAVFVPYDAKLGVHEQNAGFTMLPEWDFEASRDMYPLMLHAPYFDIYRKQVIKQADLELAMVLFDNWFDAETTARNVDYYERRTVRDSSLSAGVQAVICARVGHLDLAYDYAYEAALIDLRDLHNNSSDGLHVASLAGAWIALVAGFGGMRDTGGTLCFDPQLPSAINRLSFALRWHGKRLRVEIKPEQVVYMLEDGEGSTIDLRHAGEEITVRVGESTARPLTKRVAQLPRPQQPPGREPPSRSSHNTGKPQPK
jgi:trehalose/maltose hydrolase-like predicted phosphorylase